MSQAIRPRRWRPRAPGQRVALQAVLTKTADAVRTDFLRTTKTWSSNPSFGIRVPDPMIREIATSHAIYAMLDAGTPRHLIFPRRSRVLHFTTPFQSKTLPQWIGSRGGKRGTSEVWSRGVDHPGTAPRDWALTLAIRYLDLFPTAMQREIKRSL